MQYLVPFLVLQPSLWKEKAGCFLLMVFFVFRSSLCSVPSVDLQFVIVAFSGQTHLLFL